MRERLFKFTSMESKNSSTHVAHGLNPSTRPTMTVNRGRPNASKVTRPTTGRSMALDPACGGRSVHCVGSPGHASPVSVRALSPSKRARIRAGVICGWNPTMTASPITKVGTPGVSIPARSVRMRRRLSASASCITSCSTIANAGRSWASCSRKWCASRQCGQPSRAYSSRITSAPTMLGAKTIDVKRSAARMRIGMCMLRQLDPRRARTAGRELRRRL